MQNRKCLVLPFLIFLNLLVFANPLFAQSTKFVQKLEWEEDPYALEYKVEIEGVTNSSVKKKITTKECFVEFSLPSGDYRYRVFAFDFLGREASCTNWIEFTIDKAIQPKVDVTKADIKVRKNSKAPVKIPVDVKDITDESQVVVINEETGEQLDGKISVKNESEEGSEGTVSVTGLTEGKWKVVIKNPGGLTSESQSVKIHTGEKKKEEKPETVESPIETVVQEKTEPAQTPVVSEVPEVPVEEQKPEVADTPLILETLAEEPKPAIAEVPQEPELPVEEQKPDVEKTPEEKKPYVVQDINILAGGIIPLAIFDSQFADFKNAFDDNEFPWGLTLKLSWLPFDAGNFQFGFESSSAVTQLSYANDYLSVKIPLIMENVNVICRYRFNKSFGVNVKLGGGIALVKDEVDYLKENRDKVKSQFYGFASINGGLSVNWIPFKHMIMEAGVDYTNIFIPDLTTGIVTPYVSLGLRF